MQLKYLTLNIWKGGMLFDAIVDFIKQENPDIIAMQEVYNGEDKHLEKRFRSVSELKKETNYPFAEFSAALFDKTSSTQRGNAVFSHFPIIEQQTTFFDIPYKTVDTENDKEKDFLSYPYNLQHVKIDLHGTTLNVFNTHGIWGTHGADTPRRLQMGEIIANAVKDKNNVILSGDFNLLPITQTVAKIEKHLKNVFKNELTTTFNMKHKTKEGYATAAVDMIFVSPDVRVIEHYMPEVDVSDHMPLVCIVEI